MIKEIFAIEVPLGPIGGPKEEGFGPWGFLWQPPLVSRAAEEFTKIISRIIGVMTIAAGIWFVFQLLIGAYGYLAAGGDSKRVEEATRKITNAFIGLIVVVLAYAFISLLGKLLGFDILNPQDIIELLGPG